MVNSQEFGWDQIPQCLMGPLLVVLRNPCVGGVPNLGQVGENIWIQEMLEALADSKRPNHRESLEWVGDDSFGPGAFDPKLINATLKKIR